MQRRILDKLAELSVISRSRLSELAQREGLSLPPFQLRVLSIVGRFPEQQQQSLLQRRGWDKGQVARAFKELERLGLIRRCGKSTSRRIVQVALTTEGRQVFERLEQVREDLTSLITKDFSPSEAAQLDSLLGKALRSLIDPMSLH